MRKPLTTASLVPLLLVIGALLAACSSSADVDEALEETTQSESTSETDDSASEDESSATEAPEMLPFEEDGPVSTYFERDQGDRGAEFTDIPNGWPEELPLPATGEMRTADRIDGDQDFYQLYFQDTIRSDFDELAQYYQDAGFETITEDASGLLFVFESDHFYVELNSGEQSSDPDKPLNFIYLVYWEWPGLGTR